MATDWLSSMAGHVEAIAAIVTTSVVWWGVIYKKIVQPIKHILHEVTPNGGSSIKDAIDEVRDQVYVATAIQDAVCQVSDRGIWRADESGFCLAINDAACRLAHRSPDDMLGDNWRACIPVPDRAAVVAEYMESVAQGRHFQMRFRFIADNGTLTAPVEARGVPIKGVHGRSVGFVGFMWPASESPGQAQEMPLTHLGRRSFTNE